MKFGVLYDFRNPPRSEWFTPWPQFYAGAFAHMQEMERLGFDALSLAEHHGDPEGYNPGITVTLTAAMRTQRVRICSNIIQLPLYHPVLLAEQLAARRGSKRAIVAVGHTILTISVSVGDG